jgi:hypothetical protein
MTGRLPLYLLRTPPDTIIATGVWVDPEDDIVE